MFFWVFMVTIALLIVRTCFLLQKIGLSILSVRYRAPTAVLQSFKF